MLSEQEKDLLAAHFRGKDIYEPSKDPGQEPADFEPKMCGGSPAGYDSGGTVTGGPQVVGPEDPTQDADAEAALQAEQSADVPDDLKDGLATKQDPPVKSLQPDQWGDLVKALSSRPSVGQAAMSGLAGLADAIETGVARTGSPGFQKNITEQQQNQRQNLINALTAKYGHERAQQELGLRGKELEAENARAANALAGENTRAAKAVEAENQRSANSLQAEKAKTAAELGVRAQEAQAGRQQAGIEAAARLPATGLLHPYTWGKGAEIESVRNQLLGQGIAKPVLVKTHAEWAALPKGTHYVDANGKAGVKK